MSKWEYEPELNGGWFTGAPFHENAPWRSFPVLPAAAYLNNVNLRSANPPAQALFLMQTSYRPGNTDTDPGMPGVTKFVGDKNFGPFAGILCMPCVKKVGCTCGYECDCKELCSDAKVEKCPCQMGGCPTKWVKID